MATALKFKRIDAPLDPETVFVSIYGESEYAFWLDSSRPGAHARFSFMGDASGPLAEVLRHEVGEGEPLTTRLQQRLEQLRPTEVPDLPFEFDCGFVGYLGYEMKAECGYSSLHQSEHPDAALIFSDRLIAFDHDESSVYLLCLHEPGEEDTADAWISEVGGRLVGRPGESRRTLPAVVRR
ncbi:MAG: aminodeoxychorismate synthase component I, partial [Actinomycetota bacterium]|nr:aminodeoxychorismate synthase component I [Actinomycetota bacterium]